MQSQDIKFVWSYMQFYIHYTSVYLTKGVFTVGSLKLYQHYFMDSINPFPGPNIPQTFTARTSAINIVHDDMDKIKTMFFGVKLLHYVINSSWFYIQNTRCSISLHPPTAIHRFAQKWPTLIINFIVHNFLLLKAHQPCIINGIAACDPHIVITGVGLRKINNSWAVTINVCVFQKGSAEPFGFPFTGAKEYIPLVLYFRFQDIVVRLKRLYLLHGCYTVMTYIFYCFISLSSL